MALKFMIINFCKNAFYYSLLEYSDTLILLFMFKNVVFSFKLHVNVPATETKELLFSSWMT